MTTFVDHYKVLGLPTGEEGMRLSERQISKGYKTKALKLHPDKRPADEAAAANVDFQRLQASFQVLMNSQKRRYFHTLMLAEPKNVRSENLRKPRSDNERRQGFPESRKKTIGKIFRDGVKMMESVFKLVRIYEGNKTKMEKAEAMGAEISKVLVHGRAMLKNIYALHQNSKETYAHGAKLLVKVSENIYALKSKLCNMSVGQKYCMLAGGAGIVVISRWALSKY